MDLPHRPRQHIVRVDDERDIRDLLQHYLQGHGSRVTKAVGQRLMAVMECDPSDLVLLDLGLPGEDGMAIARGLASQRTCGIVILSARAPSTA